MQIIEDEQIMVIAYKQDYKPDTTSTTAIAGQDLPISKIQLEKLDNDTGSSGEPVSIFLASISSTILGVKRVDQRKLQKLFLSYRIQLVNQSILSMGLQ